MLGAWLLPARRMNIGEATEAVLRDAAASGYASTATGANTFRLLRSYRKFGFVRRTESFDIAVIERRDGVSVHVDGTLWSPLLALLHSRLHHDGSRPDRAAAPAVPSFAPAVVPQAQHPYEQPQVIQQQQFEGVGASAPWSPNWTPPSMIDGQVAGSDSDRTVVRGRPGAPSSPAPAAAAGSALLRFAAGETLTIPAGSAVVIGRDPAADPDFPGAQIMRVDDRSLSRTHLSVGFDGQAVWVVDRHSTNGVLFDVGGRESTCTPGVRTPVPPAARVVIGDRSFVVDMR